MFMFRVSQALPAGIYTVRVDGQQDQLRVSYTPDGDAVIRLSSRTLFRSEPVPLTTSGAPNSPARTLVQNMSYGIDSGLQIQSDRLVLTNSTIRGNEKTLSGIDRNDTGLEIDLNHGPVDTLFITDRNENWSVHRGENRVIESRSRIEILR